MNAAAALAAVAHLPLRRAADAALRRGLVRHFQDAYEREPRARQLAQTLVSVANLTRAALISARPEARRELLRELSDREGIHIYPADPRTASSRCRTGPSCTGSRNWSREQLGPHTRLTLEREGERALFVSFRIDDSDEGDYWLALPRERIDRVYSR
jgi:two-component system osmolarity sensor histidine kinase EnvZ